MARQTLERFLREEGLLRPRTLRELHAADCAEEDRSWREWEDWDAEVERAWEVVIGQLVPAPVLADCCGMPRPWHQALRDAGDA
jgi:hypothetical protein